MNLQQGSDFGSVQSYSSSLSRTSASWSRPTHSGNWIASKLWGYLLQPIKNTTQIWVATRSLRHFMWKSLEEWWCREMSAVFSSWLNVSLRIVKAFLGEWGAVYWRQTLAPYYWSVDVYLFEDGNTEYSPYFAEKCLLENSKHKRAGCHNKYLLSLVSFLVFQN